MQKTKSENMVRTQKSLMNNLAVWSVFIYIVSAIAFELTAETAFISTLAIYVVFVVGFFYLVQGNALVINEYVSLSVAFCLFVLLRNMSQGASQTMGLQIAYWEFTCTVLCLLAFWMAVKYPEMIEKAMLAYIIGSIILSLRLVSEYGGVQQMIDFASSAGEHRVGGLLGNANSIGLSLANGILCCLFFLTKKTSAFRKSVNVIILIALATMLLLTGSRKATLFVLFGFVLFFVLYNRKENIGKKLMMYIAIIAVLVVAFNIVRSLPMFSTIIERFELLFEGFFSENPSYQTDETRKEMISTGFSAFTDKPIFGNGTGHSYKLFQTYSHNNFIELLMNYGMVGFALYYTIYAVIIVKLFKRARVKDPLAIYFLVYICVQVLLGVGAVSYYGRTTQVVVAMAFGYLTGINKQQKGNEVNDN